MQTFLPSKDFRESAKILDNKRLGKQRVEAMQILNCLSPSSTSSWANHPTVRMWKGYEFALKEYYNAIVEEWIWRGFHNTMVIYQLFGPYDYPPWLQDPRLCYSHRCRLMQKNPLCYKQYNWEVDIKAPYWWPVPLKDKKKQSGIEIYYKNFKHATNH